MYSKKMIYSRNSKKVYYNLHLFLLLDNNDTNKTETVDMEKFKQDWEDQEIGDNFDVILKQELKL